MKFRNRVDAGRQLAERIEHLRGRDLVVLALPRGGVPVAAQVAEALDAPLDVVIVRKLGVPGHEEFAMGAIAPGVRVLHDDTLRALQIDEQQVSAVEDRERAELERRVERYRGDRPPVEVAGKTVVVVDDGIATGATAKAACEVVRAAGAGHIVLAVPVAPPGWPDGKGLEIDDFVVVFTPEHFMAIGQWYDDFGQTSDEEVTRILART